MDADATGVLFGAGTGGVFVGAAGGGLGATIVAGAAGVLSTMTEGADG